MLWGACIATVKIGILLLYLAIFRSNRTFKVATYILLALVFCFGLSVIVAGLAMCRPMAKMWNPSIAGTCVDRLLFFIVTSGINMGFDVVILVWPLPLLWGLQVRRHSPTSSHVSNPVADHIIKMRVSKKIELTLIFGVGFL